MKRDDLAEFALKQPPKSEEAEQSLLGALLIDNAAIDRMGDVRPEMFYRHDHRIIFTAIAGLIVAGKSADVITVFEHLGSEAEDVGGLPYLNGLQSSVVSSSNITRYAEIVRDKALQRALITACDTIAAQTYSDKGSAVEKLDAAYTLISALAEKRTIKTTATIREAAMRHVEVLEGRNSGTIRRMPTKFADVDHALCGGLSRGNLIIVAARPSVGKTALAVNFACNMAKEISVLMLSQEMTEAELMDRVAAQIGRVSLNHLVAGLKDSGDNDWGRYTDAIETVKGWALHIDDQPSLTLLDIRSKAMATKRKHGLDVLIVDYLQLCVGDANKKRYEQIEEITRGLKALAKELNIALIALSQLNRQSESRGDGRPNLSDLRDSGSIEQDADVVMFLHRPKDAASDPFCEYREIIFGKNRQGETRTYSLRYEGQYTLFQSMQGEYPTRRVETAHKGGRSNDL